MLSTAPPATGLHALLSEYDNALSCIRCGLCLSVCPTYQISMAEEESPRGRIAMARAVAEGALPVTADFVEHSESCLLCEACTAVCPAGVQMEPLGVAVRETIARQAPKPPRSRLALKLGMDGLLGDMRRFRLACRLARVYQRSGLRWLARRGGVLRLLGLSAAEGLLPEMPARFVVARGQVLRTRGAAGEPALTPGPSPNAGRGVPPGTRSGGSTADAPGSERPNPATVGAPRPALGEGPGVRAGRGGEQPRVALFVGCIMSTTFAETTRATARLLARRGYAVELVAGQGCCGALHLHSGALAGARRLATVNVRAFEPGRFEAIVVNSAGCGSTLKGYGHLLDGGRLAGEAAAFAAKVRDITELLDTSPVRPPVAPLDLDVTYQEPCHLAHAQRITAAPRRLLGRIPGLRLREMRESALCCGSAGIYNVTHPRQAGALLDRKLDHAEATGAAVILTANPGCLLQLRAGVRERGLSVQVAHIADVLDAAERRAEA